MSAISNLADQTPFAAAKGGDLAFVFVKALAAELSSGAVCIPSFPDVALRAQRVLSDPNSDLERIVRVLGAEPALAARVLSMANSAALNPSGTAVTELRVAVTRMGLDVLRSAAIAFAMAQIVAARQYASMAQALTRHWQRSVAVASLCRVIARRHPGLNADAALLAGLLAGVGRLYILTRAGRHPGLFADEATLQSIIRDWHADITKALLESWKIDAELIEAIHGFEDAERVGRGALTIGDVLAAGELVASFRARPELLELRLAESRSAERLGITSDAIGQVLADCDTELSALRAALGQ